MNEGEARRRDDVWGRLAKLFHPGPLYWLLQLTPRRSRFQAGPHMHGLAEHDIKAPAHPRSNLSR